MRDLIEAHMPLARRQALAAKGRWGIPYEDALSNAHLALVEAARTYRAERGQFENFAAAHIRGRILTGIRSEVRAQRRVKAAERACETSAPGPHRDVEAGELWRAVGSLPAEQRLIVLLHYKWGLSQTEIARTLETTQSRVWRILNVAYRRLAEVA